MPQPEKNNLSPILLNSHEVVPTPQVLVPLERLQLETELETYYEQLQAVIIDFYKTVDGYKQEIAALQQSAVTAALESLKVLVHNAAAAPEVNPTNPAAINSEAQWFEPYNSSSHHTNNQLVGIVSEATTQFSAAATELQKQIVYTEKIIAALEAYYSALKDVVAQTHQLLAELPNFETLPQERQLFIFRELNQMLASGISLYLSLRTSEKHTTLMIASSQALPKVESTPQDHLANFVRTRLLTQFLGVEKAELTDVSQQLLLKACYLKLLQKLGASITAHSTLLQKLKRTTHSVHVSGFEVADPNTVMTQALWQLRNSVNVSISEDEGIYGMALNEADFAVAIQLLGLEIINTTK